MEPPAPGTPLRRLLFAALCLAPAALLVAAAPALAGPFTPQAEGPQAEDINTLYVLVLVIAAIVFVGVEGLLFYSLIRYRARKGAVAAQIHGNTQLEIGWTVGAFAILLVITVVTFIKLSDVTNPPRSDIDFAGNPTQGALFATTDQPDVPGGNSLEIKVDGQQYVWRFQYPDRDNKKVFAYEEMVVPVGVTVVLEISSDDTAHSWWIPALGGKQDALPGYKNYSWFKATKEGVYRGQCAELCGRNHANMLARVRAVNVDDYEAWVDRQAQDIEAANQAAAEERAQLEGGAAAGTTTGEQ